ncbi:MAG: hypothetical protein EON58_05550 [Alphaproteobacteria bacterium]|nr:MAG: hypothetical protein EON58_05550 [Alphaproteobacteria bacterium]
MNQVAEMVSAGERLVAELPARLSPKTLLPVGGLVTLEGVDYIVERRVGERWQLISFEKDPLFLTDSEVVAKYATGSLYVQVGSAPKHRDPLSPMVVGLKATAKNHFKYAFVKACAGLPRSRKAMEPKILEVATSLGRSPPGFTTVLGWQDRFSTNNGSIYGTASLSDRDDCKGRRGGRLPFWQEDAITAGLERWLVPGETMVSAYSAVTEAVAAFDQKQKDHILPYDGRHGLRRRYADGALKPPPLRTFERRCAQVNQIERDLAKKGLAYVKQRYATWQTMLPPDRPYAEVECDHCTLDIQIVDPTGLVFGRPDLIVFIDRATKMILGYSIGFEAPSYASFMKGLQSCYFEKDLSAFPAVTNPWPCFGRIENLYVDNALHFIGNNIAAAGRDLQFDTTILPPRQPWLKGLIERFFGSLNTGLVHRLPGTTLNDFKKRRDAENIAQPSLTLEAFEALLVFWICQDYHVRVHGGLGYIRGAGDVPLKVWADKVAAYSTPPLPSPELFEALAGDRETRTIQRQGIQWDNIFYQSPALALIKAHPDHKSKTEGGATTYQVIRNPFDLGAITLVNHHTNETVRLPAARAYEAYASGTTLHQHKVCNARAIERVGRERVDFQELQKSRAILNEAIAGIVEKPSFKAIHRKLARFVNGNDLRQQRSDFKLVAPTLTAEAGFPPLRSSDLRGEAKSWGSAKHSYEELPPSAADESKTAQSDHPDDDLAAFLAINPLESSYDF